MKTHSAEKYLARLAEVDALQEAVTKRAQGSISELGATVGRLLEAAGDVLRRLEALKVNRASVRAALNAINAAGLEAWASGFDASDAGKRLARAAAQAVESAMPDSPDDAEPLAQFAMQDLMFRDRLESQLVAVEAIELDDAKRISKRLREALKPIDAKGQRSVAAFTALNDARRLEGQLLDAWARPAAYWLTLRTGLDDDALVRTLGGETSGLLPPSERSAHEVVTTPRSRTLTIDDLLRIDLGLASPAEVAVFRAAAERDPELKLVQAAMKAGDEAIDALALDQRVVSDAPVSLAAERQSRAPHQTHEAGEFKVLVFRAKTIQLVVQPARPERFAAAAVFQPDSPQRSSPPTASEMGQIFDMGPPESLRGKSVRVVVRLTDGETATLDLSL